MIDGGAGNDVLSGQNGIDTITGGTGDDTFAFGDILLAANSITIVDFEADDDKLSFSAAAQASLSAAGATVAIVNVAGATDTAKYKRVNRRYSG